VANRRTKPIFENGYFYHIYNRGVEKRNIFLDDQYYKKFLDNLMYFNDQKPTPDSRMRKDCDFRDRDKLVEIYAFVLMPNHFHLIVKQLSDGGIEKFMRKLGIGYAMYFNIRQQRVGALFQGRFKAKLIESDEQLLHLTRYIHINPIKLHQPDYKEVGLKNKAMALDFLNNFKWSSYRHFVGTEHSTLIEPEITEFVTPKEHDYVKFVEDFL